MRHFFEAMDAGQYDTQLVIGFLLFWAAVTLFSYYRPNRTKRA